MDEYEVELIDYLRVIWKGKWIILASLVIALVVTAGIMWTRPNEYAGTATYRLYDSLSMFGITGLDEQELLNTVMDFHDSFLDDGLTLTAKAQNNRVQVTLSKATSAKTLAEEFDRLISLVRDHLNLYVEKKVAQAIFNTSIHINQLTCQHDTLKEQIDALDSPDPEDPLYTYLAQETVSIKTQLVQEQVNIETLQGADLTKLFTLETLGTPVVSKIGPNREMSLAVAGVLGLFCGVLLAFFIHYLMGAQEKELGKKGH